MSFPNIVFGSPGDEKRISSSKNHPLGTVMMLGDGRTYHYAHVIEAITHGKLCAQIEADETAIVPGTGDTINMFINTGVAVGGVNSISLIPQADPLALDMLEDGFLYTNDAAGQGQIWKVKGNTAAITGAISTVTLEATEYCATALTTLSELGCRASKWKNVQIWDESTVVGVPLGTMSGSPTTASPYCWIQNKGDAMCLVSGADHTIGKGVCPSPAADGAIGYFDHDNTSASSAIIENLLPIGYCQMIVTSTEYELIDLKL